jgi:RNA polymerase sigma-70 factor (ECF subfamily)
MICIHLSRASGYDFGRTAHRTVEATDQNLPRQPTNISLAREDDLQTREDARLLHAIGDGDERALAVLYQRRGGLVFSVLARMLGNEAEAQEVLQDTFIRLWRRAREFDEKRSSATTWLLLFARGLALDRLRARSRHMAKISEYEKEVASLASEPHADKNALQQDELADACRIALKQLPEPQGRALELAFFRGWTHEEIAGAQGEPLGTVKARIRRGLLTLQKVLKDYHG